MGMCVPKNCDEETIREYVGPLITRYAEEAGFTNTELKLSASMEYTMDVTRSSTTGKNISFLTFGFLAILGTIGGIISCTKIGNNPDIDIEALNRKDESQYETTSI